MNGDELPQNVLRIPQKTLSNPDLVYLPVPYGIVS